MSTLPNPTHLGIRFFDIYIWLYVYYPHYIDKEGPGDNEYDYSNSDDEQQLQANIADYVSDEEQPKNNKHRLERYARQSEQKLYPHTITPGGNGDYGDFTKMHEDMDKRIIPLIENVIIPECKKAGISSEREKDGWLWAIMTNPLAFHAGVLFAKYLQIKLMSRTVNQL